MDASRALDSDALSEFVGSRERRRGDRRRVRRRRRRGRGRSDARGRTREWIARFLCDAFDAGAVGERARGGDHDHVRRRERAERAAAMEVPDEDLKAMLARVVATYEACVSSEGKDVATDRIASREAWTRAMETAEEALRASAETTASEDAGGQRKRRGFEKYPTFHGTERIGGALDALSLTSSAKNAVMDARTASTLAMLRRDRPRRAAAAATTSSTRTSSPVTTRGCV